VKGAQSLPAARQGRPALGRAAGLGLLAGLWAGPLPGLAGASMTAHMLLHLGVVIAVPALLAPRWPARLPAPGPAWLAAAALLEMAVVWGWHAPAAHFAARTTTAGLVAEQASFLAAGCLLWASVGAAGRLGGAAVLLATVMHMTLLGALIGLSPRVLCVVPGALPFGLTALEDQQLAGALMAGLGGAAYLGAALARLAPLLDGEPAR